MATSRSSRLMAELKTISLHTREIIDNLLEYLKTHEFQLDPRVELFTPGCSSQSKIITLYPDPQLNLKPKIVDVIGNRLISAHLSLFTPGMDFIAHRTAHGITRCVLPLILGHPCRSTGIWIEGRGVVHHQIGKWIVWDSHRRHNFFNYSKGDRVILVLEVHKGRDRWSTTV